MFPLLYWDANREWVTLFAGGCNQQPEMHMMAEGTRYLATSRYLAKSPILPLFWGLVFHVWWISLPTNMIKNEELDVHLPRTEKETSHENSIFCGLKQIITNHTFLGHVSLQSNDRWNPACWFNKPCEIAIFGEVPKGSELIGGYYCNYRPKVADTYRIITVIIIIISYDWLMDYILRLVIG